jgi:hypothetical protein
MSRLGLGYMPLGKGVAFLVVIAALFLCPVRALASTGPSKWLFSFDVGLDVDRTRREEGAAQEERNECTATSKDVCEVGEEGTGPREFSFDKGVAVSKLTSDVYVGDNDHRVQALGPEGKFLFMFGWNVDKTKLALGAGSTQAEKNLCTAVSGDECGEGERGTGAAGQMASAESVAVDPLTGNVYVLDPEYNRVEEYTATGEFLLMIGGAVNSKGGNLCAKAEESECRIGSEGSGHGEFEKLERGGYGNLLTFGGPEDLLYVADEGGVQKFETSGTWTGQVSVPGATTAVAADEAGDVFVVDSAGPGVHEYNETDELQTCVLDPSGARIHGLGLDAAQLLALTEWTPGKAHGSVYESQGAGCGQPVSGEIAPPSGEMTGPPTGVAFSSHENGKGEPEDQLYVAGGSQIEGYLPVILPEAETCPTTEVRSTTAELCGAVNPDSLPSMGFFEYGVEAGNLTVKTGVAFSGEGTTFQPMSYELGGLVPNQQYYDQAWAETESEGSEQSQPALQTVGFHTKTPAPEIPGQPAASFVTDHSALLAAKVDPEHAPTAYRFEYSRCENESQQFSACLEPRGTAVLSSEVYGSLSVTEEVAGLAPRTVYAYRLSAENSFEREGGAEGGRTEGAEGHMTTSSLPEPSASTGEASAVTATSAIVSGAVDPDGPATTYVFELGLHAGSATRYGIVASGTVDEGHQATEERLVLTDLQPATTYAYRIAVESGYIPGQSGETQGEARLFTTGGVPALLESPPAPAMLAVPPPSFPKEHAPLHKAKRGCRPGYKRGKHGKCVKVSKTKKATRSRSSRRRAISVG